MASGTLNTSKVANERIALAVVTAALGFLTALFVERFPMVLTQDDSVSARMSASRHKRKF